MCELKLPTLLLNKVYRIVLYFDKVNICVIFSPDILMQRMVEAIGPLLTKNDLRYLMKKFQLSGEKITELEQKYHGKENLSNRISAAVQYWREFGNIKATTGELIRILHLIGYRQLSHLLINMKTMAQRVRL